MGVLSLFAALIILPLNSASSSKFNTLNRLIVALHVFSILNEFSLFYHFEISKISPIDSSLAVGGSLLLLSFEIY